MKIISPDDISLLPYLSSASAAENPLEELITPNGDNGVFKASLAKALPSLFLVGTMAT